MKGLIGVTMIEFEEVCQRLAVFERNESQKNVAGEGQIEGGVGSAVAVPILLPGAGVAFMVIAVFY
jgi:hypothetical protein